MGIVITHPTMGVYVGNCLGLGFWTLLDSVGQPKAATFENENQAREHVKGWPAFNDPDSYTYVKVNTGATHATIADLKAAGLEGLLGDMELDALMHGPAAGNA